ncbi:MAG: hypothetical protein ACLQVJ_09425 [Syntrophobacteraceae bacterium]
MDASIYHKYDQLFLFDKYTRIELFLKKKFRSSQYLCRGGEKCEAINGSGAAGGDRTEGAGISGDRDRHDLFGPGEIYVHWIGDLEKADGASETAF